MNPSLNVTLQTVEKPKQGFSLIEIDTLGTPFGKTNDIICNRPLLGPFCQCLSCLESIVRWLEVVKQHNP